jgi:hypothetical protein
MSKNFNMFLLNKMGIKDDKKSINLIRTLTKDKPQPKTPVYPLNYKQMMDLITLPTDKNGYKFALIVMDLRRFVELKPLKNNKAATVLTAIKYIYKNSKLKPPFIVQFDNGAEFKNKAINKYFEPTTNINYIKPYRSRQNGLVENFAKVVGAFIGYFQNTNELKTGSPDFEWVQYLKQIQDIYNETQKNKFAEYEKMIKINRYPVCKGKNCNLLKVNEPVLIPLEKPIKAWNRQEVKGSKKFRSNDIRFNPNKTYKIKNVILHGNEPPLYQVNQPGTTSYTRGQLIEAGNLKDDITPDKKQDIQEFTEKRKNKKLIEYKVKYSNGLTDWKTRKDLIKELGKDGFNIIMKKSNI